jgi:acyl-coenzyme A thioesterase PaaI-like protein
MATAAEARANLLHPIKQKLFLWSRLPGAAFMGCRIDEFTPEKGVVSLPYGWRSQNPFKSIYFAAQCAAAELSTGILSLNAASDSGRAVSMLVVGMKAEFVKKATLHTTFTCAQGADFAAAIAESLASGEGKIVTAQSIGVQADGEVVSRFEFTWSLKAK